MAKISPADEGIEAARRDVSAHSRLLEIGAKAETLSRLIANELNSRMLRARRTHATRHDEAHGAVRINWGHVGDMNYTHEKLVLIANALGLVD
jgi:hypothetical protein